MANHIGMVSRSALGARLIRAGGVIGMSLLALANAQADSTSRSAVLKDCAACPELIVVPAGQFRMGSNDGEPGRPEGPTREVALSKPFALGRTEVTNLEFEAFIEATGYTVGEGCRSQATESGEDGRARFANRADRNWRVPGFVTERRADHPVVCVSHADATAYVAWLQQTTGLGFRLPTEAEWEYAARAGNAGIFSWGSNIDLACRYANVYDRAGRTVNDFGWGYADCDDGYPEIAPVGQLAANAFGLHDMIGNVWEWTADCYQLTYDGAPNDGSAVRAEGDCARWSVRGGGWMTRASRQRLTFRGRDPVDARYSYFGFRVARDLNSADTRP